MGKYCEYPWTMKVVKLFRDSNKFCCKVESLPSAKHDLVLKEVKKFFLNDQEHPACSACWNDENKGGKSFRLLQYPASKTQIIKFDAFEHSGYSTLKIIDVEFGYTCNMSCITCGPGYSSTWQQLVKFNPWSGDIDKEKGLEKLRLLMEKNSSSLEKINLFGGEPSVDPMYYAVADLFEKSTLPACSIRIITNGNYSETWKVKFENSIQKFRNDKRELDITMSLDGAGEDVEFIRGGLKIDRFIDNVKAMIEFGVKPTIQISISVLNLENYIKVFELFEKENLLDKVNFRLNKVSHPYDLSYNILGGHIKEFMPVWPEGKWARHRLQFEDFIGDQRKNNLPPDRHKITELLSRLEKYTNITDRPYTKYYSKFIERLNNLLVHEI